MFVGLLAVVLVGIFVLLRSTARGTPEETRRARAALSTWILTRRLWLGLAFGGAMIGLTGVAMWAHAMTGVTVDVDLRALERGEENGSSFVRVREMLQHSRAIRVVELPLEKRGEHFVRHKRGGGSITFHAHGASSVQAISRTRSAEYPSSSRRLRSVFSSFAVRG